MRNPIRCSKCGKEGGNFKVVPPGYLCELCATKAELEQARGLLRGLQKNLIFHCETTPILSMWMIKAVEDIAAYFGEVPGDA